MSHTTRLVATAALQAALILITAAVVMWCVLEARDMHRRHKAGRRR